MKTFIAAIFLASQAVAQDMMPGTVIGSAEPSLRDNQSLAIFEKAIAAPNATRSIKFKPFEWYSQEPIRSQEWTWRVNVTEFALPGLKDKFKDVSDPSFVSTSYDFQWPGGGNLSETLGGPSSQALCVGMVTVDVNFPQNVTDLYTEEDTSSTSCEPVVGKACLDAIYSRGSFGFGDDCGLGQLWSTLPECNATLGASKTFGVLSTNINPAKKNGTQTDRTNGRNVTSTANTSGGGFGGLYSGVINGTAAPQKHLDESNRLHMVMISHAFDNLAKAELLCMRVNATKLSGSDGDSNGGGNGGNGGGGSGGDGGSAAPAQIRTGWTMALVIVPLFAFFA